MLTTAEASQSVQSHMPLFDSEDIPVDKAAGRVLQQSVRAERDQPPFDRVTMDGIAIDHGAFAAGRRTFAIQGTQHAGEPAQTLTAESNCIEIMTGAVRPEGADCIVPVERIRIEGTQATIEDDYAATQHQFVHPQGSDYRKDDKVLNAGIVVSPLEIAIIASCGLTEVRVCRQPVVRVISTGDELVPSGSPVAPHQVRLSNGPAIAAMLARHGYADTAQEHLLDEPELLRRRLGGHLDAADVLILSGGVSMGKADFVPGVLRELGVEVVFHKISQRPGLPMWFGIGPDKQAVFALPGNPVSTLVCCRQYVLPALDYASGLASAAIETAALAEDVVFEPQLTCFLPVRIEESGDARIGAVPVPTNTSGDFRSLSGTDGYVELERDASRFAAGTIVPLHRW